MPKKSVTKTDEPHLAKAGGGTIVFIPDGDRLGRMLRPSDHGGIRKAVSEFALKHGRGAAWASTKLADLGVPPVG